MKKGKFAIYKGKTYSSGYIEGKGILLRSTNIEDLKNGFEECEPFYYGKWKEKVVCIKYVERSQVEDYYKIRIYAIYKGYKFELVDEKDDKISIVAMTGDYRIWLSFGMQCIDKGVYQKWIDKNEAKILIKKEEL